MCDLYWTAHVQANLPQKDTPIQSSSCTEQQHWEQALNILQYFWIKFLSNSHLFLSMVIVECLWSTYRSWLSVLRGDIWWMQIWACLSASNSSLASYMASYLASSDQIPSSSGSFHQAPAVEATWTQLLRHHQAAAATTRSAAAEATWSQEQLPSSFSSSLSSRPQQQPIYLSIHPSTRLDPGPFSDNMPLKQKPEVKSEEECITLAQVNDLMQQQRGMF